MSICEGCGRERCPARKLRDESYLDPELEIVIEALKVCALNKLADNLAFIARNLGAVGRL